MDNKIQKIKSILTDTETLIKYGSGIIKIIIILAAIKLLNYIGSIAIDRFFSRQKNSRFGFSERKADTMGTLLKSVIKYGLYLIGFLSILDTLGIETRALMVGAGLGGVAIGLGAQGFIKDIISGFFILFEDQFSVGEYVSIDSMSGIVESIGLRITRLKDFSGDLHIIPNGSISKVTNHSRDNSRAVVDVEVGFDQGIDKVIDVLSNICGSMKKSSENIVDGPTVLGITELGDKGAKIRITAATLPMKQVAVEMELRRRIKDEFEKENILIPYSTHVIITKKWQ